MWLYVPSAVSQGSAGSTSGCTLRPEAESSATWNGKPIRPQSWRNVCKTAPSVRRLSGLTSPPSTLERGVDAWISSLADSRARTSAWPGLGPASKANDLDSGQSFAVSIASLAPDGCSLRTSQPSLFADSSESSVTLPRSGALRNGCVYERPTWAPRTGAIGSSYSRNEYPTPSATPYGSSQNGEGHVRPTNGTPSLETWATPMSRDHRSGSVSPETLAKNTRPLSEQVLGRQGQSEIGDTSRSTSSRRMNPAFVAWLMGLPWWWTQPVAISSARWAMASYRSKQRSLLRSFVPGWPSFDVGCRR